MPVGVIKRIKAPPEAFLAVCDVLGIEDGGPGTPGCMFEWAHSTDYGFRVVTLFDSEAHAQANVQEVMEAAGKVAAEKGWPALALDAAVVTFTDAIAYFTANVG